MTRFLPIHAAQPGRRARDGARLWLLLALATMLVLVKSVDLHFHEHIGAPASTTHLADVSTAHDAGHGDLDVDIQGEGSLHQIPSVDLLPMLLFVPPIALALLAGAAQPRWAPTVAVPPPWRHRANGTPPALAPPLTR